RVGGVITEVDIACRGPRLLQGNDAGAGVDQGGNVHVVGAEGDGAATGEETHQAINARRRDGQIVNVREGEGVVRSREAGGKVIDGVAGGERHRTGGVYGQVCDGDATGLRDRIVVGQGQSVEPSGSQTGAHVDPARCGAPNLDSTGAGADGV